MRPHRLLRPRPVFLALCALLIVFGAAVLVRPPVASAHPLGNFTINRYTRVEPGAGQVQLRYVLDMAEIPTFQEMAKIDIDRDGEISDVERATYSANKSEELIDRLYLSINDSPVPLQLVSQQLSFPPGQGGLPTLRLSLVVIGQFRQSDKRVEQSLYFRDENYVQRLGWKEIVVTPGDGVSLRESTAPQQDRSDELRSYPGDMLNSPPNQREARSSFVLARIHRRTALGTALEEASGCSSESGIMVLEQKPARKQGAPNRCCHRTNPTVSASSLTTIAWWPMLACSCRPP